MHVPKVVENALRMMHKMNQYRDIHKMKKCIFVSQDLMARGIDAFYDAAKRNKVVYT